MLTPATATNGIIGKVIRRGAEGYEHARRGTVWHSAVPDRFPEIIVVALCEDDVVAAVRLARTANLHVAVRAGGHSWSASHLRDDTLLVDVSNLRRTEIDADGLIATVEPGLQGLELLEMLHERDLFFPVGHSSGVGIGGYLLQGGFGWAGPEYGPACMSVTAVDVVTADGQLVHADDAHHAELLWAARGAGPGFFGVVTKFFLRVYPRRAVTMSSIYLYPAADAISVCEFVHRIGADTHLEITVHIQRHPARGNEIFALLTGVAYCETEAEAVRQLATLESFPARARAVTASINRFTDHGRVWDSPAPDSHRDELIAPLHETWGWVADSIGTHAPFDQVRPRLEALLTDFPRAPSVLVLFNWGDGAAADRPDMAFSVDDDFFYALEVAWEDPDDAAAHIAWVTATMREWESIASGTMLADENLLHRPFRFMSEENLVRLDRLRNEWDPEGVVVSWLGRPQQPLNGRARTGWNSLH